MAVRADLVIDQADAPVRRVARNGGIDALRAAVTLLVVLHHTALTYGAIGGWYYQEIPPSTHAARYTA